jgi:hypothetical protein
MAVNRNLPPSEPDDNSVENWKSERPKNGASTQQFREWGKRNPDRLANAEDRLEEFEDNPTTMTRGKYKGETSKTRKAVVDKWKSARPAGGAGIAKDAEGAAKRREEFIKWAGSNPNKGDNAKRAIAEERKK